MWWLMHLAESHGSVGWYSFLRMVDARDCGSILTAVRLSGSGYVREFSGYAFPTGQSDRVTGTGCRDTVHLRQGPGTVRYK